MVKWNKIFVLSLFVPLTICLLPLTVIGCNKSTNKREWNGLQNPRIWWTQGVEFVHTSFVQCYENNFIDGTYDVSMGYNSNTLLKTWNGVSAVASFDNANGNWLNFSGTPTNACVSSIWISIDGVKSQVQIRIEETNWRGNQIYSAYVGETISNSHFISIVDDGTFDFSGGSIYCATTSDSFTDNHWNSLSFGRDTSSTQYITVEGNPIDTYNEKLWFKINGKIASIKITISPAQPKWTGAQNATIWQSGINNSGSILSITTSNFPQGLYPVKCGENSSSLTSVYDGLTFSPISITNGVSYYSVSANGTPSSAVAKTLYFSIGGIIQEISINIAGPQHIYSAAQTNSTAWISGATNSAQNFATVLYSNLYGHSYDVLVGENPASMSTTWNGLDFGKLFVSSDYPNGIGYLTAAGTPTSSFNNDLYFSIGGITVHTNITIGT